MAGEFVPSQVDEAAEMAEKLFEQLYAQKEEEEAEEIPTEDEESDEASEDEEDEEEVEEEPEIDPKELKKWRDRYLTLKGKYDAEVPRLSAQVKELMEKVTQPSKPTEKEEPVDEVDDFTSVYGEDFVAQLRKIIQAEVKPTISQVEEKVTTVEDAQRSAVTESFMSYLDDTAEGWRDLWEGKDKGFQKFLQQKDPMGLNTYEQYLNKFNENWDADGMAKIFNLYNEQKQAKKPSTSKEQEAMIAPPRQKAAEVPTSKEKRFWTAETIKEFEVADRQGKYTDEQSQALWADLLAAANEGRIR